MKKLKKIEKKDSDSQTLKEESTNPNDWQKRMPKTKLHDEVMNWVFFWGFIILFFSFIF